jgi:hypothetical protein
MSLLMDHFSNRFHDLVEINSFDSFYDDYVQSSYPCVDNTTKTLICLTKCKTCYA